ncbi:MAG: DUF559 domain-containing protein [Nitrospirae bacterium]|nr:DUF559 domain-containing protein [Nitrospirota bacterium]
MPKLEKNIQRDKEVNTILQKDDWKVLRFWQKEIENDIDGCIKKIENTLNTSYGKLK